MPVTNDETPAWPTGTLMCGACSGRPATVTWPGTEPVPMCNRCYTAHVHEQQGEPT